MVPSEVAMRLYCMPPNKDPTLKTISLRPALPLAFPHRSAGSWGWGRLLRDQDCSEDQGLLQGLPSTVQTAQTKPSGCFHPVPCLSFL